MRLLNLARGQMSLELRHEFTVFEVPQVDEATVIARHDGIEVMIVSRK